jgi:ABC-2 type transport system ATP-binding protein
LFLDEPTTGLDPRSRLGLWGVIESLVAEGTTVLLTTQYLEEADKLADDIVVIDHGRVIAHGSAEVLKDQIGGDRIEVRVADIDRVRDAQVVLGPVFGGESLITENLLSGPVSGGSTVLVDVVRLLDSQNIAIADLALRRPTLDDVFLSLTGHNAEDETIDKPAGRSKKGRKQS